MLRKHQTQLRKIARQIARGRKLITDILVYVLPGGDKSAIAAILAAELPGYQIVWVVPRLALRDQGARDFRNPELQALFGQSGEMREASNGDEDNLTRGTRGYITTYQSVVADTALHVREVGKQKTILILDETHHAPEQARSDQDLAPFYEAVRALAEKAAIRVYASGTLTRHDGRRVAFVPHVRTDLVWECVDFNPQPNWAKISYTRATAVQEKAILDITVELFDGRIKYTVERKKKKEEIEFQSFKDVPEAEHSLALYAALRSPLAYQIIDHAIEHWRAHRLEYPSAKLLVIAPQINVAQEYHKYINGTYGLSARIATSDDGPEAQTNILHFKGVAAPETDVLVTVGMAYEGLDVRQITHVVLLTHIRSVPWLNQAISRANRVEASGKKSKGFVFCPADKPLVDALRLIDYIPAFRRAEWAEGVEGTAGGVKRGTVLHFDGNTTTSYAMSLDGKIYIYPGELRKIQQLAKAAGQAGADPIFVKLLLQMGGAPTQQGEVVITQPVLKQQEQKTRRALHQAIVTRCTSRQLATQRRRLAKYNRRVEEKYGPRAQMTLEQLEAALNDVINGTLFPKGVAV